MYYGNYLSKNFKNLLLQNRLADFVQIWFVDTYGGLDLNLFKLGHCDLISRNGSNKSENHIFDFFSEKASQILLIFGMEMHLVDLYQVCYK